MFARRARRTYANTAFIAACAFATGIALVILVAILASLLINGAGGLNLHVFTMDTPAPGSDGGLRNAIVGSLILCLYAMIGAVVVGVLAGTWLSDSALGTIETE